MMKNAKSLFILVLIAAVTLFAGCSPAPQEMEVPEVEVVETVAVSKEMGVEEPAEMEQATDSVMAPAPTMAAAQAPEAPSSSRSQQSNRLIIKNGDVRLLVTDTLVAIDRTTQIVEDIGGYIVSSRTWYAEYNGENYLYASYTIGVPVDEFEHALRRLREISVTVLDEQATGEDVTDEYVDLQSQLDNLKATRDRIREFLDQAKTVEEALQVNEQLSEVEAQIAQIQGRMNYLFDRASYSTINIQLEPLLPEITPSPTPTRSPTVTPTPWRPGETAVGAVNSLGRFLRGFVDFMINLVVLVLPVFLLTLGVPLVVIWWLWRRYRRRKARKTPVPAAQEPPDSA